MASDIEDLFGEDFIYCPDEDFIYRPEFNVIGWQEIIEPPTSESTPASLEDTQAFNTTPVVPTPSSAPPEPHAQQKSRAPQAMRPLRFHMINPQGDTTTPSAHSLSFQDNTPRQINQQLSCPTCSKEFPQNTKEYWTHLEKCTTNPTRPHKRRKISSFAQEASQVTAQTAPNFPVYENYQQHQGQIPPVSSLPPEPPYNLGSSSQQYSSAQPQSLVCSWSEEGIICNQMFYREDDLSRHIIDFHKRTCMFSVYIHNQWQLCLEGPFANHFALMNHIEKMHTDTN